jgi:hypothetical protein
MLFQPSICQISITIWSWGIWLSCVCCFYTDLYWRTACNGPYTVNGWHNRMIIIVHQIVCPILSGVGEISENMSWEIPRGMWDKMVTSWPMISPPRCPPNPVSFKSDRTILQHVWISLQILCMFLLVALRALSWRPCPTQPSLSWNICRWISTESATSTNLSQFFQTIKQNKNICTELLEQTCQLLNAIMMVHIKSDTGGELPPSVLNHIGKFTEYVTFSWLKYPYDCWYH